MDILVSSQEEKEPQLQGSCLALCTMMYYCMCVVASYCTLDTMYVVVFDGLIFHGWQLGKDFCNFIVKVCLYPSCGCILMKENLMIFIVTANFISLKNDCMYCNRLNSMYVKMSSVAFY